MRRPGGFPALSLIPLSAFILASCLRKEHANVGPFIVPAYSSPTPTRTPTPACSLAEAVDRLGLGFSTYGDAAWFCQSAAAYQGGDAAQSGNIADNEYSVLGILPASGPGTVTFYWSVSSESGWDYLEFYMDGVWQNGISGAVPWSLQSYPVAAGSHNLEWVYIKDSSVSTGSDCGWVDAVTFP